MVTIGEAAAAAFELRKDGKTLPEIAKALSRKPFNYLSNKTGKALTPSAVHRLVERGAHPTRQRRVRPTAAVVPTLAAVFTDHNGHDATVQPTHPTPYLEVIQAILEKTTLPDVKARKLALGLVKEALAE